MGLVLCSLVDKIKIMKSWKGKLFANTFQVFVLFFFVADKQNFVYIKLMTVTCNPRDFTI